MSGEGSTTAAIKSQLVRAWRQRWSDAEWSVHLKALLPLPHDAYMAEPYQLPGLLLKQALVGASPNALLLTYFRHAAHSQLVKYSTAIMSLVKYDDVDKPYCTQSLLHILAEFTRIIQKGPGLNEGETLGEALAAVLIWLLTLLSKDLQGSASVVNEVCDRVSALWDAPNLRILLCLVCKSNTGVCEDLHQKRLSISDADCPSDYKTKVAEVLAITSKICEVKDASERRLTQLMTDASSEAAVSSQQLLEVSYHPLNISINVLLNIEAVLHPTNPASAFIEQVLAIKQAQGLSDSELVCELFRTGFMSLVKGADSADELKVTALTYLKMPSALVDIVGGDKAENVERGIQQLLNHIPLLDLADSKCKTDCFTFLLKELLKHKLLSEQQSVTLQHRRQNERQTPLPPKQSSPNVQPSVCFIIMAENTVTSILKALDADYTKNQESLHGILHKMMTGRSFKLIVAAAAATNKLPTFATKLVKFNEFAKVSSGETPESSVIRAQLFDITFLMLTNMNQLYKGSKTEMLTSESASSFYSQWAQRCLPENGHYKSLDLQPPADMQKVELLLNQLSPSSEIKTSLTKWHDVCRNIQYALQQVLYAWEQAVISQDAVKTMMEKMRSQMCCLPVICVAWLCSYINTCEEEARQKPLTMIKMFQAPHTPEPNNTYYSERCHLMQAIIADMIHDLVPGSTTAPSAPIPSITPAQEMLLSTYHNVFSQGSITITQVHRLHQLLKVAGPRWFTYNLVKELLRAERGEELSQGVALIYGLFHMDIEGCITSLLHHTLPTLLRSHDSQPLSQPRASALASLTAMCLVLITPQTTTESEKTVRRGKKRSRPYLGDDDEENSRPSKLQCVRGVSDQQIPLPCSLPQDIGSACDDSEAESKDPVVATLGGLFNIFIEVLRHQDISPSSDFILEVLKHLVKTGTSTMNLVHQAMSCEMLVDLLTCFPREVDAKLLLKLSDLSDCKGRETVAKSLHLVNFK